MLTYVLWPDQNGVSECWSGARAGVPGVSFMAVTRTNPVESMTIVNLDVDLGNITAVVASADDAGIPPLDFAVTFDEPEVPAGEVQTQDIEPGCL